jgi:DNA-binding transcriptional MerR regulator
MKKKNKGLTDDMMTTGDVALIFDVHPATIRRWSKQGKLKPHSIGQHGERKFRRDDVAVAYLYRAIKRYLGH